MVNGRLLQQGSQASAPAMAEAWGERLSVRRVVGVGLPDAAPDHSTISRFRPRRPAAGGAAPRFAAVEQHLAARGLLVKQGPLVAAPVRRPRGGGAGAGSPRDPDAAGPAGARPPASATSCPWAWTPTRSSLSCLRRRLVGLSCCHRI